MVCHETYKDENNKWYSPDEVDSKNGKDFYLKIDNSKKIKVGPSESCQNLKNTIDPEIMIDKFGAMQ